MVIIINPGKKIREAVSNSLLITTLLFFLASCGPEKTQESFSLTFEEIATPMGEGGEGNLHIAENESVYLSWVAYLNDTTDALFYSRLMNGKWDTPTKIAEGANWFVNWADFPSLAAFNGVEENLAAHWLQKSAMGTYDYDVRISLSDHQGKNWSPAFIPHTDGIPAEHGFVTMLPLGNGRILATWLDGRNTKTGEMSGHDHGHGHGGAMTLRTAEFDQVGKLYEEAELDSRICDCCQTDAATTPQGPAIVYRDRSEKEIRDISIVRKIKGKWTAPRPVFQDNWEIAGCPVNGPAIAASGNSVVVAWFTGAENKSRVKVAFSKDTGATFSSPITIDDGQPLGRVDVIWIDEDHALVSWLEQTDQKGEIRLARVNREGKTDASITAVQTNASRQSGFPILEKINEGFLLAWTNVDSITTVKTMAISIE